MKFLGMGGFELVIILIVILIIFGPKNLPKLGNALGKTLSNLRSGMNEGKKKEEAVEAEEAAGAPAEGAPQVVVAEIEGEVQQAASAVPGEPAEKPAAADASFDPEAAVDEAFNAKKVRRVVKKRVTDEPSE